ncbi:hypothetical protein RU86_GL001616 [Lactococcus piscium]|uniref:Uncharacterized protein n=1 Tax=Pseudolactococcus piscium TaxID=1364 RepID=A0A2A5RUL8_9LACT|nr:hypothetical protein RU86_GL001616 [Lactococcus piscium]
MTINSIVFPIFALVYNQARLIKSTYVLLFIQNTLKIDLIVRINTLIPISDIFRIETV